MADHRTPPGDQTAGERTGLFDPTANARTIGAPDDPTETIEAVVPKLPGYEIMSELGRGGMGVVYKAHQRALNRIVALKVVLSGAHAKPEDLIRFLGEAEVAARLRHQGIIQIYESGRHEGLPFYTMEYADGGSLAQRLNREPMAPLEAARLVFALADATRTAHEAGVIHRDLKPSNILLSSNGHPKITDFGLARRLEAGAGLTQTGTVLGTPSYMAPEQARGDTKHIGAAADIYSIGAILYECLTGRPPFVGKSTAETISMVLSTLPARVRSLAVGIPHDLETICQKCLEKQPAQRYATAAELAADLRCWLDGRPIAARPIGPLERLGRWAKRNPAIAGLVTAVFGLLATVAVGALIAVVRIDHARDVAAASAATANDALAQEASARSAEADAKQKAEELAAAAKRQLTRLYVATGSQAHERNEPTTALLWYERAWDGDSEPSNEPSHRTRIGSVLDGMPRLAGVCFHPAGVDDVDIDADGKRLVTRTMDRPGNRGARAYIWDYAAGKLATPPLVHSGPVRFAGFSPNGKLVLTASEDKSAVIWDAATGKKLVTRNHANPVVAAAFSPDGSAVATAAGNQVNLWDPSSGERRGPTIDAGAAIYTVEFSRRGDQLLTADCGGYARVWRTADGQAIGRPFENRVPGLSERIFYKTAPALSPNGEQVLTLVTDQAHPHGARRAQAHNVATGELLWEVSTRGYALGWSPNGQQALICGGNIRVVDVDTGKIVHNLQAWREAAYAVYTPNGKSIVAGISGGGLCTWDATTGQALGSPLQCADFFRRIRYSGDGRIVTASQDGTARVWEGPASRVTPYRFDCGQAHLGRFPDGSSASPDGRTRFRPGPGGGTLERPGSSTPLLLKLPGPATASRFSGDGKRLATFAANSVRLWDAASGEPIGPALPVEGKLIGAPLLSVSTDGRRMAAIFDINNASRMDYLQLDNPDLIRPVAAIVWDASGRRLFTLPAKIDSGQQLFGQKQFDAVVSSAALSADGRLVAAGVESSGELSLFEVDSGKRLYRIPAFRGWLYSIVFHPTGRTVLTGSSDGLAREFDLMTGTPAGPPVRESFATTVAGDPHGLKLATIALSGAVRIWDARTSAWLAATPEATADRYQSCWFSRDGTTVQFFKENRCLQYHLPSYAGPQQALRRAASLIAGHYLDSTDGLADVGPNEFIDHRDAYRKAWMDWQGLQDDPEAQP